MLIATASVTSSAPASAFFERWADVATWPEWNTDTAWVRLDGPFATGTTGRLKPKGGPAVRFVVERLSAEEFVDVSRLVGARLTFGHRVTVLPGGGTRVDVAVTLTGPLRRLWNAVLGRDIAASVQPDLDRLAAVCEHSPVR